MKRSDETQFKPTAGRGDVFDSRPGILPNNNFSTWDKNRCFLLERCWPAQGAVATLYDSNRRSKADWKRGQPVGTIFGMALADVATGPAAEHRICAALHRRELELERLVRLDRMEKERKHQQQLQDRDSELSLAAGKTIQWIDGRAVILQF